MARNDKQITAMGREKKTKKFEEVITDKLEIQAWKQANVEITIENLYIVESKEELKELIES